MKKKASTKAVKTARKIVPFDDRRVQFSKFKPELSLKDLQTLLGGAGVVYSAPIETLSPSKPYGRGRTSLDLDMPTEVQLNALTPSVSFNLQLTPSPPAYGPPTIWTYFDPFAYGITWVATYLFEFLIGSAGAVTLNMGGDGGPGSLLLSGGSKVVDGGAILTVILQNVPPTELIYVSVEQTGGGFWQWYSTVVRFPPPVPEQ